MLIQTDNFSLYFGNKQHSISLEDIHAGRYSQSLQHIKNFVRADFVALDRQEHGVQGHVVTPTNNQYCLFEQKGDFLITQQRRVGVGVVTADCLPMIVYDKNSHTVGAIHAGWKGSFSNIAKHTFVKMDQSVKNVSMKDIEVYIGPAARICCYEVSQDFYDNFAAKYEVQDSFKRKNEKWYFDNTLFAVGQLINLGILPQNIYTQYSSCTICDTSFCSYRRDKENADRQISMIALH